jgi:hypothetical protein
MRATAEFRIKNVRVFKRRELKNRIFPTMLTIEDRL